MSENSSTSEREAGSPLGTSSASSPSGNASGSVSASASSAELERLAKSLSLPFLAKLPEPSPPRELVRGDFDRIAGSWGRAMKMVPIGAGTVPNRLDPSGLAQEVIVVASADPLNSSAVAQLELCYGKRVAMVVTSEDEISRAINAIRSSLMAGRSSALNDKDSDDGESETQLKIDVTDAEDDDAPIIRYVNAIIFRASSQRASDVHIEPYEERLKVRFRVDGVLIDVAEEDKSFHPSIVSRIKVMAGLNIAERRLPQDGRIGLKIAGRDVDIRVSSIPTQFGERIVLRLLDKSATVLELPQVGLIGRKLELVEKLIRKPNGIILVTGPTGSGKTTTLYSCLSLINTPDLNILTVEDPIEYQLDGIGQMQVNPKINFTFASGLRAILRQDPDVVMVGEIRDSETAEIAIQASLTGHLVLSTLHTNDSPGAIGRLIDMGCEPFLVASSLLAVMAQRLVRKLCPHCKEAYEITDEELLELGLHPAAVTNRLVFRPGSAPCERCQNNRYLGRTGIHELLVINDAVRSLILQRVDASSIRAEAIKHGFETLRMDGAQKVLNGDTSVEEVLLATHEEAIS